MYLSETVTLLQAVVEVRFSVNETDGEVHSDRVESIWVKDAASYLGWSCKHKTNTEMERRKLHFTENSPDSLGRFFSTNFYQKVTANSHYTLFFLSCRKCKDLLITSLCAAGCNTVLLFLLNSQERSWRRCFSHSKRACQLYSCSTHINTQLDSMPGRHKSQP